MLVASSFHLRLQSLPSFFSQGGYPPLISIPSVISWRPRERREAWSLGVDLMFLQEGAGAPSSVSITPPGRSSKDLGPARGEADAQSPGLATVLALQLQGNCVWKHLVTWRLAGYWAGPQEGTHGLRSALSRSEAALTLLSTCLEHCGPQRFSRHRETAQDSKSVHSAGPRSWQII